MKGKHISLKMLPEVHPEDIIKHVRNIEEGNNCFKNLWDLRKIPESVEQVLIVFLLLKNSFCIS